ncbi:unnamed protein product [Rhizophagus irregularis]|nr:unnamed protein product [Rhizophagus irregularis]
MEQCWDADPTKRPDIEYLKLKIQELCRLYYQNEDNEPQINNNILVTNYTNSNSINSLISNFSKVHIFKDLPEPRTATEGIILTYHSLQLSLSIPDKIGDIISEQSECQAKQNNFTIIDNKNETKGKSKRIYSEDEKEDLTDNNKSKKIKLNSNKVEFQYMQRNYFVNDDVEDDETFNNPNFHSEDQDELEIPEDGF